MCNIYLLGQRIIKKENKRTGQAVIFSFQKQKLITRETKNQNKRRNGHLSKKSVLI
jgi:hypothetical protein